MFDIASWKAGVTVSRSCAAASTGTRPGKAAIAASVATIAIDRIFILLSYVMAEDGLLRPRGWRMRESGGPPTPMDDGLKRQIRIDYFAAVSSA
jgi:hypothetical protein